MGLNERARKKVTPDLAAGETLRAIVRVGTVVSGGGAHGDGASGSTTTVFSLPYAGSQGITFDDARLRFELMNSWISVTDRRMMFHSINTWSARSLPKGLIDDSPLDELHCHWFDHVDLAATVRIWHITFADERHLLLATMYRARVRRSPYNDEPDLFVEALGDAAIEIDHS